MTVRIPAGTYSELCKCAAELGVSLSAHVKRLIEQEHRSEQVTLLRTELLSRLSKMGGVAPASTSETQEILLLCRAIAAHVNPQLVAQVRAKLNQNK